MNPDVDEKEMEITLPVASPDPFGREDENGEPYIERLRVTPESVLLGRLNGGASVLKNHNADCIFGVVVWAKVENERLYVRLRFRKNDPESVAAFRDAVDGTLPNVSVGYFQHKVEFRNENGVRIGDVVEWEPFEISVAVGVPADATVGFYRSMIQSKGEKKMADEEDKSKMNSEDLAARIAELEEENKSLREAMEEEEPADKIESVDDPEKDPEDDPDADGEFKKSKRSAEEQEIRAAAAMFGVTGLVPGALRRGVTPEEFREEVKGHVYRGSIKTMERKKEYSAANLIRSLVDPSRFNAAYERRVSDQIYAESGVERSSSLSVMLDTRYQGEEAKKRAFDGTAGVGANLIGTDHRGDMFIDILRTVMAVNPTIMPGLRGNVDIPLLSGSSSVDWVDDLNGDAGETAPAVGGISLTPKKLTGYVDVGLDMILQANPEPLNIVINDLMEVAARKVENAIFHGVTKTGWTIPGLAGTTGVKTVTIADVANATWQDMLKFGGAVAAYKNPGLLKFAMSASDRATLKGIAKDAGSGRFICEDNEIDGSKVDISGELKAGDIYFGDFSRVLVGRWGGLEIMIDPYAKSLSGKIRIIIRSVCDIVVRQPEAFVKRVAA